MAKQTFTTGQVLTAAQMTSLQQTAMMGGEASAKVASYTLVAADAGTAISMSNASATTITVNTALFAAGDTVQITNLGAGVCTITAGTATVNTASSLALAQYESGTLDFTSTSTAIFIKGAGAVATSGGMTLLASGTLSGAALSLTSISSAYNELQLKIYNAYNSGGNAHTIRINNISAANYQTAFVQPSSSTVANTENATSIACVGGTSLSTAYGTVIFTIPNYKATTAIKTGLLWAIRGDQGGSGRFGFWNLSNDQLTTAINRIDFLTTVSFSGGTYELWGIK